MNKEHKLKTWPEYFEKVLSGEKTFEFRKNDRGFQVGDILILEEYSPTLQEYTGRKLKVLVTYIFQPITTLVLPDGYCIMSIKKV